MFCKIAFVLFCLYNLFLFFEFLFLKFVFVFFLFLNFFLFCVPFVSVKYFCLSEGVVGLLFVKGMGVLVVIVIPTGSLCRSSLVRRSIHHAM